MGRRLRVRGWPERIALGLGIATGAALGREIAPTGQPVVDALWLIGLTTLVVWLAASAPSAVLIGAALATVAVTLAGGPWWAVALATAALVAALVIRWRQTSLPAGRAAVMAALVVALAAVDIGPAVRFGPTSAPLGTETLIAVVIAATVAIAGLMRRRRRVRRRVALGVALGIGVIALGVGIAVATALGTRDDLRAGIAAIDDLDDALRAVDLDATDIALDDAAARFDAVHRRLGRPWMYPARAVPIVAQHLGLAHDLSGIAAREATSAADNLALIDPAAVAVRNSTIDLDAVAALQRPVTAIAEAVARLGRRVDDTDTTWLVRPLTDRLNEAADDLDRLDRRSTEVVDLLGIAPTLLGAERPVRYLVAFTTPAESRGLGGFMGAFAEVLVDDGRIDVTRVDAVGVLEGDGLPPEQRRLVRSEAFLTNYGRYGFDTGPGGTVERQAWSNITVAPDLPTTATAIAELYPQSGGAPLDGVVVMDPLVLEALIGLAGGARVDDLDLTLTGSNTARFLLIDMYARRDEGSTDKNEVIADVGDAALRAVLERNTTSTPQLARTLLDLGRQRRFGVWFDPERLAGLDPGIIAAAGIDGAVPRPDGRDGFMFFVQNAAPNKADVYLERTHSYEVEINERTGRVDATLVTRLTNTLTPAGLPEVVTGNNFGEPPGSMLLLTTHLTRYPVTAATLDGDPFDLEPGTENGWQRWLGYVTIPPGATAEIRLTLAGETLPGPYDMVVIPHPLARPETVAVRVATRERVELLRYEARLGEIVTLSAG